MRGNPVLKAKRVRGPSAHTIMHTYIALERCRVRGCKNHPEVTFNPDGVTRLRYCLDHVSRTVTSVPTSDLLKLPWEV